MSKKTEKLEKSIRELRAERKQYADKLFADSKAEYEKSIAESGGHISRFPGLSQAQLADIETRYNLRIADLKESLRVVQWEEVAESIPGRRKQLKVMKERAEKLASELRILQADIVNTENDIERDESRSDSPRDRFQIVYDPMAPKMFNNAVNHMYRLQIPKMILEY